MHSFVATLFLSSGWNRIVSPPPPLCFQGKFTDVTFRTGASIRAHCSVRLHGFESDIFRNWVAPPEEYERH